MSTASLQQALSFDRTGAAKERLLSRRGEPLFYANWDNVLFIHYELESDELQRCIPKRFLEKDFEFGFPNLREALANIYPDK